MVYGTRGGATKAIAEEIGKALAENGFEPTVRDARETKGLDVKTFDLVVVGSSLWAGMWTGKATGFLKDNQAALATKKIALFSSGITVNEPDKADIARLTGSVIRKDLEKKGIDTSKPYDTRDFAAIRQWAVEVANKARQP